MSEPCIICVAITGSLPTKENNAAVPITIDQQVESTRELLGQVHGIGTPGIDPA